MSTTFVGLGSNQGDREAHLKSAVVAFRRGKDIDLITVSPVYETEAHTLHPEGSQRSFLNAVARLETVVSPEQLLTFAQEIERSEGRQPDGHQWAARPLDLDLLAYDADTRTDSNLTLPHPRLANRRFVLRPWADIAPTFAVPPPFNETVGTLLDQCPDTSSVRRTDVQLDQSTSQSPGG